MQFMFSDQPALLERRQGSREHESTGCEASDMPLFALGRAQTAHSYGALTKLFCVRSGINPVSGTFSSLTWRRGMQTELRSQLPSPSPRYFWSPITAESLLSSPEQSWFRGIPTKDFFKIALTTNSSLSLHKGFSSFGAVGTASLNYLTNIRQQIPS